MEFSQNPDLLPEPKVDFSISFMPKGLQVWYREEHASLAKGMAEDLIRSGYQIDWECQIANSYMVMTKKGKVRLAAEISVQLENENLLVRMQ